MPGLSAGGPGVRRLWRHRGDDRGVVATLVVVLLGGGVLLGMGALVIDVGRLYVERAELQNGADAAALAVARGCATNATTCTPATAAAYAGANAKDGSAAVSLVCGYDGTGRFAGCPASTGDRTDCPAAPASGSKYVDVHTSTLTAGGSTLLPPTLARAIVGNEDYEGTTVRACARAGWGAPSSTTGVAFTISHCEWNASTAAGTSFAAPPPYPPNTQPPAALERVVRLHGTGTACGGGASGWDLPGGFGWLSDTTGRCGTMVDVANTYPADTGVSAGGSCKTALTNARAKRAVVFVPVFDGAGGTGHSGYYHLRGFGAFVVTGYHLPGLSDPSWLSATSPCKGTDKCIYGYFTQGLTSTSGSTGGPELGASIVQLSG